MKENHLIIGADTDDSGSMDNKIQDAKNRYSLNYQLKGGEQMKHQVKLIIAAVAAIVLSMAFTASAFAATGNGYYEVDDPTEYSNPISVKIALDSKEDSNHALSAVYNVTLGEYNTDHQTFTVRDAMLALADNTNNGLFLYNDKWDFLSGNDTYLYCVQEYGGGLYFPTLPYVDYRDEENPQDNLYAGDGWAFRVNGNIPVLDAQAMTGANIAETPIEDGDVIHFYWDYKFNMYPNTPSNVPATFLSANMSYNSVNHELDIQITKSKDYYDSSMNWTIDGYTNYTSTDGGTYNVVIYDANMNQVTTSTIPRTGHGVISYTLSSGTYYVKVHSVTYHSVYDAYNNPYTIVDHTSAFEKLVIS